VKLRAFACCLLLCLAARAQEGKDAKDTQLDEIRLHVAAAKVHYDLGEFKEAADEYILVYRLKPIPAVLFNIAQAYRQAGLYDKARQFYKSYLRESPNATNKAAIEQNIREMDELLAKEKRTRESPPVGVKEPPEATLPIKPPTAVADKDKGGQKPAEAAKVAAARPAPQPASPAPAPAPAPDRAKPASLAAATPVQRAPAAAVTAHPFPPPAAAEESSHTLTWVLAGGGVALLGGGTAFMLSAGKIDSELTSEPHARAAADDLVSQSKSKHMLSGVLFAAGVAALAGAAATLLF